MILLDTHVLYWHTHELEKLGKQTKHLINASWQHGECTMTSMSFWEFAMLQNKGRIKINTPLREWVGKLRRTGLIVFDVSCHIGILANELDLHGDPADRIIAATAITQGATLVTADSKLLDWQHPLKRFDARL